MMRCSRLDSALALPPSVTFSARRAPVDARRPVIERHVEPWRARRTPAPNCAIHNKIDDQGVGVLGGPTTAACARVVIGYLSSVNPTVPSRDSPAPGGHL